MIRSPKPILRPRNVCRKATSVIIARPASRLFRRSDPFDVQHPTIGDQVAPLEPSEHLEGEPGHGQDEQARSEQTEQGVDPPEDLVEQPVAGGGQPRADAEAHDRGDEHQDGLQREPDERHPVLAALRQDRLAIPEHGINVCISHAVECGTSAPTGPAAIARRTLAGVAGTASAGSASAGSPSAGSASVGSVPSQEDPFPRSANASDGIGGFGARDDARSLALLHVSGKDRAIPGHRQAPNGTKCARAVR